MDKSIEAAVEAANACFYRQRPWNLDDSVRAAIAAYRDAEIADLRAKLEAAERDAGRYRFLKGNFGICRPFDELLMWHPDEIDAAIDYAARGGERG